MLTIQSELASLSEVEPHFLPSYSLMRISLYFMVIGIQTVVQAEEFATAKIAVTTRATKI
jgi:hypothetical protein